jgi:hypothetical protein
MTYIYKPGDLTCYFNKKNHLVAMFIGLVRLSLWQTIFRTQKLLPYSVHDKN